MRPRARPGAIPPDGERQRLVVALARRARQQEAAARLGRDAVAHVALQQLFEQAVERVADTLEVPVCHLAQATPGSSRLVVCAGIGWRGEDLGNAYLEGGAASLEGYTLASGEPVISLDLEREERFGLAPELAGRGLVAALSVAVGERGRPFGTLSVLSDEPREFTLDDTHFLATVASLLASAVQRDEALAARRRSDRDLERTRRLEALARLASGIAHDFNNSLTAILFSSEVLLSELPEGSGTHRTVSDIHAACLRASELVSRLAAFGRQPGRHVERLELNEIVAAQEPLLRRILGRSVRLEVRLEHGETPVEADRSQLEQVLFHLVADARDAMPGGGELRVETARVETIAAEDAPPGPFVMLAVHDAGAGGEAPPPSAASPPWPVSPLAGEVGFGRSAVYGIVEQSGGHLRIERGADGGSVSRVFLPRAEGARAA